MLGHRPVYTAVCLSHGASAWRGLEGFNLLRFVLDWSGLWPFFLPAYCFSSSLFFRSLTHRFLFFLFLVLSAYTSANWANRSRLKRSLATRTKWTRSNGIRAANCWPPVRTIWPWKFGPPNRTSACTIWSRTKKRSTRSNGRQPDRAPVIRTWIWYWRVPLSTQRSAFGRWNAASASTRSPSTRNQCTRSHSHRAANF